MNRRKNKLLWATAALAVCISTASLYTSLTTREAVIQLDHEVVGVLEDEARLWTAQMYLNRSVEQAVKDNHRRTAITAKALLALIRDLHRRGLIEIKPRVGPKMRPDLPKPQPKVKNPKGDLAI